MMLGVYDYTVVLTYVSVLISMGGMLFSMNGYPRMAIVCLALSGFCGAAGIFRALRHV